MCKVELGRREKRNGQQPEVLHCSILPCGSLDAVRVLHADGRVDVYHGGVTAGDVMNAFPGHVLALPTCRDITQKPTIPHRENELEKGKVYFLLPTNSSKKKINSGSGPDTGGSVIPSPRAKEDALKPRSKNRHQEQKQVPPSSSTPKQQRRRWRTEVQVSVSDRQASVLSRRRSRGEPSMWRPALHSISEAEFS